MILSKIPTVAVRDPDDLFSLILEEGFVGDVQERNEDFDFEKNKRDDVMSDLVCH